MGITVVSFMFVCSCAARLKVCNVLAAGAACRASETVICNDKDCMITGSPAYILDSPSTVFWC